MLKTAIPTVSCFLVDSIVNEVDYSYNSNHAKAGYEETSPTLISPLSPEVRITPIVHCWPTRGRHSLTEHVARSTGEELARTVPPEA